MKTAISIDDLVFEKAEQAAKEMGLSRSRLYTQAIDEYIQVHRPDAITQKFNEIYSQKENRTIDPIIESASLSILDKAEW